MGGVYADSFSNPGWQLKQSAPCSSLLLLGQPTPPAVSFILPRHDITPALLSSPSAALRGSPAQVRSHDRSMLTKILVTVHPYPCAGLA